MSGTGGSAAERVLALAGPDLTRGNAFRVTGLPVDAGPADVRRFRQRLVARQEAMAGAPGPTGRSGAEDTGTRAALAALADPRTRIVHELFWPWGDDVTACRCAVAAHAAHDAFVRAYDDALAPGRQAGAHASWLRVLDAWRGVDTGAVQAHLGARVRTLDDPRLGAGVAADLAAVLPAAVLTAVLRRAQEASPEAARELRSFAERWPDAGVLHAVGERIAGPVRARIRDRLEQILADRDDARLAERFRRELRPDLDLLEVLAPASTHGETAALRNRVADALNEAWLRLFRGVSGLGRLDERSLADEQYLLESAVELATRPDTTRAVRHNQEIVLLTSTMERWVTRVRDAGDGKYLYQLASGQTFRVTDDATRAEYRRIALFLTRYERRYGLGLARAKVAAFLAVVAAVIVVWVTHGFLTALGAVLAAVVGRVLVGAVTGRGYRAAKRRHLGAAP